MLHPSMGFSHHKSPIQLWWRRQTFRLRRLSPRNFIFLFICILFLIIILPNPFSPKYQLRPINQEAHWNNIDELLKVKDQILFNDTLSNGIKVIKHGTDERVFESSILIVLYTTVFHDGKFCKFSIDQIFGKSCPSKHRCQWSCDPRKYREADALIFHAFDIIYYQTKFPSRSETKPNSIWILWSDEPPSIIDYSLLKLYHFNWTISYKLNSEISLATYGLFVKRDNPLSNAEYEYWIDKEFSRRQNGALWFVSNCHAKRRLDLFYDLKHASKLLIEGYGRCVDYYPLHLCRSSSQCEYDYMSNFKFYLSFESNTCRDYITEKFYKAFYYGLIPIVYGPDKIDYTRFAPKNSFLHINDFGQDMSELANYIEQIHSNLTLFSSFHQWRKTSDIIIDAKGLERIRMCELCYRLVELRKNQITYYEDIHQFYTDNCNFI